MFVRVDASNEQDYTSILCSERIINGSKVELVAVRLTKGQIKELSFAEYEEVK